MTLRRCAARLFAGGVVVMAIACGAGVAQAQPNPPPPVPSIIDQLLTSTPVMSVNPTDEGDDSARWGGVGMFCQNLAVRCR